MIRIPGSTTMASIPSSAQSVDDSDLSYISYSGSWTTYTNCTQDYDGTLHSTTQNSASATFTFTGFNAVGALLDIPACSGSVIGSWTIDGQTGKVLVPCTSSDQTNYPFYPYTAGSSFGPTTIVVRNAAGSVPFQLDRFIVGNLTNNTPPSSSNTPDTYSNTVTTSSIFATAVTSSGPGAISTFKGTTDGVSSSGVISPQHTDISNTTPSSSPNPLPLGPIVGGVLGALALLLLLGFSLLRCRPLQREKNNRAETVLSSTLTPFTAQEMAFGHIGSDDKTALAAARLSHPSSSTVLPRQTSQTSLLIPRSDINDDPMTIPIHISQENSPLSPASPSTLIPENRPPLVPSYSPNPDRRYFQSDFSNFYTDHASTSMDVPPAYDNILGSSQAHSIP